MKRYILNIFLLSSIYAIFLLAFELFMLTVPNRYSYKYDYVEQHRKDIKVLLLGNCHIEDALNPKILGDSVFNTAISGREIIYDEELAKHFIPKMQNLKTVIMQFDYRSFGLGREKRNPKDYKEHGGFESTFKCMYTKYMKFSVDGWWYWSEIINSELNYKSRIWMDPKDAIECDSLGFVQLPDSTKNDVWEYWDLPKLYDTSIPVNMEKLDALYKCYQTIAQLTTAKNARFLLITTPMLKTYQEYMVPQVENEMKVFIGRLQKEYPNVDYYDFTRDERFLPEDFHDASHLSESGSLKFSKIIRAILHEQQ